jgi:hypothetical protein
MCAPWGTHSESFLARVFRLLNPDRVFEAEWIVGYGDARCKVPRLLTMKNIFRGDAEEQATASDAI